MPKHFYIPLETGDWMKDPLLSKCSPATRGIWIDAICAMHEDDRSGVLTGTPEQLTRVLRCSEAELHAAVDEIGITKTGDVRKNQNGTITLINRRMRRESAERRSNADRQKAFRDRHKDNQKTDEALRVTEKYRKNNSKVTTPKPVKKEQVPRIVTGKYMESNALYSESKSNTPTEDKSSSGVVAMPPPSAPIPAKPEPKPRKDNRSEAQKLHAEITKYYQLSKESIDLINETVTDLERWGYVLRRWRVDNYHGGSVGKQIKAYREGFNDEPKNEFGEPIGHLPELIAEPSQTSFALTAYHGAQNGKPRFTDKQDRDAQRTQDNLRYIEELRAGIKSRAGG